MTQCYGKALINLFFSKFSRYDVVLFVCLVLLALCLVLRLLLSCIAGQGGELPRGVIDQSDLVRGVPLLVGDENDEDVFEGAVRVSSEESSSVGC